MCKGTEEGGILTPLETLSSPCGWMKEQQVNPGGEQSRQEDRVEDLLLCPEHKVQHQWS